MQETTKTLGVEISGVHRLRANFAQKKYQDFLAQGTDEREVRLRVSELLGQARIDMTNKYAEKGFARTDILKE